MAFQEDGSTVNTFTSTINSLNQKSEQSEETDQPGDEGPINRHRGKWFAAHSSVALGLSDFALFAASVEELLALLGCNCKAVYREFAKAMVISSFVLQAGVAVILLTINVFEIGDGKAKVLSKICIVLIFLNTVINTVIAALHKNDLANPSPCKGTFTRASVHNNDTLRGH